MDRAAKNAMGIGSLEPRYHRARLPQETFSSFRRVARKVISFGTDLMSHVRRHQGQTSLAIDESLLGRCLKPPGEINDDFFSFGNAAFFMISIFRSMRSRLNTDVESDRAHQASAAAQLGKREIEFKVQFSLNSPSRMRGVGRRSAGYYRGDGRREAQERRSTGPARLCWYG